MKNQYVNRVERLGSHGDMAGGLARGLMITMLIKTVMVLITTIYSVG